MSGADMIETALVARFKQAGPIALNAELRCEPGEVLALVGPSGSGKSTILRAIAGLYRPEHGSVTVGGDHWFDSKAGLFVPPHRRRVGLVFQSYALFPHMTALTNVTTALGHRPARERLARARELLRLVHLDGLEHRRPAELSGGQQQRVAVARALARYPAVLLLDEPFSAVDRSTRQKLYAELAEIRAALSAPVIFVTHDFDEAALVADRLCLLDRGEVLQTGAPREVLLRPASAQAARLLDMKNLFAGKVISHDGDRTLIDWNGHRLVCERDDRFVPGTPITWSIPGTHVLVSQADASRLGDIQNQIPARISRLVPLSESVSATVIVQGASEAILSLTLPERFARRTSLGPGTDVVVALMPDGIHLMPAEGDGLPASRQK